MKIVNHAGNFPVIRVILGTGFMFWAAFNLPYIAAKLISGGYW